MRQFYISIQLYFYLAIGNCADHLFLHFIPNRLLMKKVIIFYFFFFSMLIKAQAQHLPDSIYSSRQGNFHVQGIAVDQRKGFVYFSFTDRLIKTDLSGKMLGSVTGIVGHLGDITLDENGKIFASLEYKNDAIGKGIRNKLALQGNNQDGFYIAIFDTEKITQTNMSAAQQNLLTTVFIKEAAKDYSASVKTNNKPWSHRFGCSGIDGLAFAPAIGAPNDSKKFLYVAYGIYSDLTRNDNDNQVLLQYDVQDWKKYERQLSQTNLHHSGPPKPAEKYFVRTGNTRYGIQNLTYDRNTGYLFAAVYKGAKPEFPNYDLFAIDIKKQPHDSKITTGRKNVVVKSLFLANHGRCDSLTGINGWHFKWGATGMTSPGDGLFYISHDKKAKDGTQESILHQYRWTGQVNQPFQLVK